MFRRSIAALAAAAGVVLAGGPAAAGVIFNNPTTGSMAWSHASTAYDFAFDGWIAQDFHLGEATTLTGGQLFMSILYGIDDPDAGMSVELNPPTGLYYEIRAYGADPTEDPQGVLASGQGTLQALTTADCTDPGVGNCLKFAPTFTLPSVGLGAGDYFFALKLVAPQQNTYLQTASNSVNARITYDHGATWTTDTRNGLALVLEGEPGLPAAAVPEPSSWALMILGFGGAGAMIRRRRTAIA
jgi:hypothetical protein